MWCYLQAHKLDRDDLIDDGPYEFSAQRGWIGSIQHHFLRAAVPTPGTDCRRGWSTCSA